MHFITRPITQKEANRYINKYHRHHKAARGDKFRIAAEYDGKICGVIQVGRPVSRMADDGWTAEVIRCCTDGTKNACSFLYSRAIAAAKNLGYKRILTYTMEEEDGASLKASGFTFDGITDGGEWTRKYRSRRPADNPGRKKRWIKILEDVPDSCPLPIENIDNKVKAEQLSLFYERKEGDKCNAPMDISTEAGDAETNSITK